MTLYAVAGMVDFGSAEAGTGRFKTLPVATEHLLKGADNTAGEEADLDSSNKTASWRTVRMRVTAYCSCRECCGKHSDGMTADGHKTRHGDKFVASGKKYSFGTKMIIPGYNYSKPAKVQDRGRIIRGNRLGVYFDSHKKALKWAVKYLPVRVKIR